MSSATAPVINVPTLPESYRFCRQVARSRAKNFYYSFLLLEKPQRDAMCAIYAFMRHCDDLSDEPALAGTQEMARRIALWRLELDYSLAGDFGSNPIWPAFCDTVQRYAIPHRFFHEMIDGITSDIQPRQIETFDELYRYCYQVASVVGLAIIHIFGFTSVRALLLAEKCGVAFQLTNIMRDVREDASVGRLYLPLEDLKKFQVSWEQLKSGTEDDAFRALMRFEASRAEAFFDESAPLLNLVNPKSRRSLSALREIYLRLLSKLEKADFAVLSHRINVPTSAKLAVLIRAFLKPG